MALFDSVIGDAQAKFNLGGKAERLLSAILALMTNDTRGGLGRFLDKFAAAGLGDTAKSWVGSGANTEISGAQLESALGADMLKIISSQSGLDAQTATAATAFMIPRIVDKLTPNGVLPADDDLLLTNDDLSLSDDSSGGAPFGNPASAAGIGGTTTASETFDRIGTSASEYNDAGAKARAPLGRSAASELDNLDDGAPDDDSPLKWIIPLVLLGLLISLGAWFCGGKSEPAATTAVTTTTNVNANKTNANLTNVSMTNANLTGAANANTLQSVQANSNANANQ